VPNPTICFPIWAAIPLDPAAGRPSALPLAAPAAPQRPCRRLVVGHGCAEGRLDCLWRRWRNPGAAARASCCCQVCSPKDSLHPWWRAARRPRARGRERRPHPPRTPPLSLPRRPQHRPVPPHPARQAVPVQVNDSTAVKMASRNAADGLTRAAATADSCGGSPEGSLSSCGLTWGKRCWPSNATAMPGRCSSSDWILKLGQMAGEQAFARNARLAGRVVRMGPDVATARRELGRPGAAPSLALDKFRCRASRRLEALRRAADPSHRWWRMLDANRVLTYHAQGDAAIAWDVKRGSELYRLPCKSGAADVAQSRRQVPWWTSRGCGCGSFMLPTAGMPARWVPCRPTPPL